MKPAKIDLAIYQGATFSKVMRWKAGGSPVDLTGYTARMQVRADLDDEEVLVELTTENGGITLTAEEGKVELSIGADDTAALSFERAVYDLELVSGETVTRFCEGMVQLFREVTR